MDKILLINPIPYQLSISGLSITTQNNDIAAIAQGILLLCFSKVTPALRQLLPFHVSEGVWVVCGMCRLLIPLVSGLSSQVNLFVFLILQSEFR